MELDRLACQDFQPHEGSIFRLIPGEGEPRDLVLVEVESLAPESTPPGSGWEPFSLVFRDPGAPGFYHQAIYRLEHPEMGSLDLFLVPIGPDGEGMRYQAVFA